MSQLAAATAVWGALSLIIGMIHRGVCAGSCESFSVSIFLGLQWRSSWTLLRLFASLISLGFNRHISYLLCVTTKMASQDASSVHFMVSEFKRHAAPHIVNHYWLHCARLEGSSPGTCKGLQHKMMVSSTYYPLSLLAGNVVSQQSQSVQRKV